MKIRYIIGLLVALSIVIVSAAYATVSSPLWGAAWEDLTIPASTVSRLGLLTDPDWEVFQGGVYALAFDGGGTRDEEVMFQRQLPHSWREGSSITPHIHWAPETADAGNTRWCFEYTIENPEEVFGATTTECLNFATDSTAFKHHYDPFTPIVMTGGLVSAMVMARLYRHATDAADTYDNHDAFLLEFDFHYQRDRPGSRFELVK